MHNKTKQNSQGCGQASKQLMERFANPQPGSSGGTHSEENGENNSSNSSIEISNNNDSDPEDLFEVLPVEVDVEVLSNEDVSDIRPMVVPIQSSEQKTSDDGETNQRDSTEQVNPTKKKKVVKNSTSKTTKARGNSKNSRPKDF